MRVILGVLVWGAVVAFALPTSAQDGLDATVRMVATDTGDAGTAGLGVVIDPRGYILTRFGNIGFYPEHGGPPGTLSSLSNRYAVYGGGRAGTSMVYLGIAEVVRADVRSDLAILRLRRKGHEPRLPWLPVGGDEHFLRGSSLGVVGADPVRRHPERRAARFQEMAKNGLGRPVAFRFEPSVPGSWAGAPIVDRTGMLVGTVLTPGSSAGAVSWGQPLARVPQDWWTDLDGGHLRFRTVEGIRPIPPDETVHDVLVWNHDASHHLFQIEDDASGSVSVDPDLPLSLWVGAKRVARGTGLLAAIEGGRGRRVAVRVSDGEGDPVAYSIRFVPTDSAVPNASSNDRKPAPLPDADGPFYVPERFRKDPGTTSKGTASVWGYVLDAVTGRPVRSATVVVGKPGVRLEGHVEDYLNGRMSERTFRTKVEAMVHTDVRGMYRVLKLAKGKRYPLVILARGYRPRVFQVSLDEVRSIYELRAVSLIR